MNKYTSEIDKLFRSKGFFINEWKDKFYSLDADEQKEFISELYNRLSSKQYQQYQIGKDAFGVNSNYNYDQSDLDEAKNMNEVLSGEVLLTKMGKGGECLEYKATYVFLQRRIKEIELASSAIEEIYYSVLNKVRHKTDSKDYNSTHLLFQDLDFHYIEYPKSITLKTLNDHLKTIDFESCFFSTRRQCPKFCVNDIWVRDLVEC